MAAPQVSIKIKNLPQIRRAFKAAPRLMNREFRNALLIAGYGLIRKTLPLTPHDTGFLKSSFYLHGQGGVDILGKGATMRAEIYPTAEYGIYVHEGTRYMKARPFLKRGAEMSEPEIQRLFTQTTQKVLDKIGRMT